MSKDLIKGISIDLVSKICFIFFGYSLNIILARLFGPSEYSIIAIILSMLTIYNVFLTNGVRQAISFFIANDIYSNKQIWQRSLIIQFVVSFLLSLISLSLASTLTKFYDDNNLYSYLLIIAIVIPFNGIYFLQIGLLNGLKHFKYQALLSIIYSSSRFILILILIYIFKLSIYAVIYGTASAYIIAFLARFTFKRSLSPKGITISYKELIKKSVGFIHLFFLITIFLNIDILLQKKIMTSTIEVGIYGAVSNIGRFSYFLFFSITSTIFPIITKLWKNNKIQEIENNINNIIIYSIPVITIIGVITYSFSDYIMLLFYGKEYISGSKFLSIFTLTICFLSINVFFANILTIINSVKPTLIAFWMTLILVIFFSFICNFYFKSMSVPICLLIGQIFLIIFQTIELKSCRLISINKNWLLKVIYLLLFLFFSNVIKTYVSISKVQDILIGILQIIISIFYFIRVTPEISSILKTVLRKYK